MWYAYRLENHIIKNYFCLICIRYKHDVIVTYQIYILCVMKNHNKIHRYWWLLIFKSYCNTVKLITYIFRFAVWLMKCITQTRNMNIAICFSLINFSKFSSFIYTFLFSSEPRWWQTEPRIGQRLGPPESPWTTPHRVSRRDVINEREMREHFFLLILVKITNCNQRWLNPKEIKKVTTSLSMGQLKCDKLSTLLVRLMYILYRCNWIKHDNLYKVLSWNGRP